jgi:hypothetical protein
LIFAPIRGTVTFMRARLNLSLSVASTSALMFLAYPAAPCWAGASPMEVQIAPGGDLGQAKTSYIATVPSKSERVSAVFQPAPIPDPDIGPPSAAARGPSLTPALFTHKEEFSGDGYADASDPDHGLDKRRTPAAGLNLSVPVK